MIDPFCRFWFAKDDPPLRCPQGIAVRDAKLGIGRELRSNGRFACGREQVATPKMIGSTMYSCDQDASSTVDLPAAGKGLRARRARLTTMLGAFGLLGGLLAAGWGAEQLVPTPSASAAPFTLPKNGYVGVASCAAQACHGGKLPAEGEYVFGCEYTTWISSDPHSRAFEVLFNEESQTIAKNMGIDRADKADLCLRCHTTYVGEANLRGPRFTESDGVGCESCHGASENWLGPHIASGWRSMSTEQKTALGLVDVKNLVVRAQVCIGCHVGDSMDRQVNHELIAAGHPRLMFETAAFCANMPKHWDQAKEKKADPALEARLWAIGQAVTAQAALTLLEDRAQVAVDLGPEKEANWPEYAEYNCYACHHDLQESSWRQNNGYAATAGRLPWGTWYFALSPFLASHTQEAAGKQSTKEVAELAQFLGRPYPMPSLVLSKVRPIQSSWEGWGKSLSEQSLPAELLLDWSRSLAKEGEPLATSNWESATQVYLGLVALHQSYRDTLLAQGGQLSEQDERVMAQFEQVLDSLRFPSGFDSPRDYHPDRVKAELAKLRQLLMPAQ